MNDLDKLRRKVQQTMFITLMLVGFIGLMLFWILSTQTSIGNPLSMLLSLGLIASAGWFAVTVGARYTLQPLDALWRTILHLSPTEQGVAPPNLNDISVGRELVSNLVNQIYQLASVASEATLKKQGETLSLDHNFIAQNLPLPLVVLDSNETIKFANQAAAEYLGFSISDMVGKNVYMLIDMSFPSEETFDSWLKDVKKNSATASSSWERIKLNLSDDHPEKLFDLSAYYNRDNPEGNETLLVMFDHTQMYSQDDQAVSFMALSVHELRTPLTLLRGYIEVFENELGPMITDPELKGFMLKMKAMSEQLTGFVNNILNVARVNDDQMQLKLQSEDWATILKSAVEMISLQAKVRGITLEVAISKELPAVGVDRLSIREVLNNLIDNAIKYSGTSKLIKIDAHLNPDGMIETTIQDFGLGIPTSVLPNLFTKFYRDHRNRAQIGGTGLGLYLSKAIVAAHGGVLWVRSKEGHGSTFGFTLLPYAHLTDEMKENGNQEITRGAHGWIKNHSLYRR